MIIIFTASNTITNSTNMETFVVHPDKYQEKALRAFLKALEVRKIHLLNTYTSENLNV